MLFDVALRKLDYICPLIGYSNSPKGFIVEEYRIQQNFLKSLRRRSRIDINTTVLIETDVNNSNVFH
jgi:hypothetical protein